MVEPSKTMVHKRNVRSRRGQALVEFALVVPLLLLILYGIVQLGFLLNGFITVQEAARIGVRAASLGQGPNAVESAINTQIGSGFGMAAQGTVPSYSNPYKSGVMTNKRLLWEITGSSQSASGSSTGGTDGDGTDQEKHESHPNQGDSAGSGTSSASSSNKEITLSVSYDYHMFFPFFGPIYVPIHQSYTMLQEDPEASSFNRNPYIGDAQDSGTDSN